MSSEARAVLRSNPVRRSTIIAAYVSVAIAVLAAGHPPVGIDQWATVGFLFVVGAVASRLEFTNGAVSVTAEFIPLVLAAVIVPNCAGWVALAGLTGNFPTVRSRLLNTSTYVGMFGVAGMVNSHFSLGIVSSTVACVLVALAINIVGNVGFQTFLRSSHPRDYVPQLAASFVATSVFSMPIVAGIAWAYETNGFPILPTVIIPLTLVQYFHGLYHKKAQLTEELASTNEVLARTNMQFASAMVRALDARDSYTAGHSAAVAVYTRDIARAAGFDERTVRQAHLAALLHDIGKIGVAGSILNKTERLTDEEFELMKEHARIGAEILAEVDSYGEISTFVRHHHERMDGRGYPDGIGGESIPAISRMISVADTYSAMTTDRPYRDGMPTEKAMAILGEASGTGQLDEMFTAIFLRILRSAGDGYQRGKQTSFDVEVAKHEALGEYEQAVLEFGAAPITDLDIDEIEKDAA